MQNQDHVKELGYPFKIMVQTNGINHHYLIGGSAGCDSAELAEDLVALDMDAAASLYQALGAYLQDAAIQNGNETLARCMPTNGEKYPGEYDYTNYVDYDAEGSNAA